MDHLVLLKIIVEECRNNKTNLLCCFNDFRKAFDKSAQINLWNRLEELKKIELRVVTTSLYENVITKFRNIEGQLEEINCTMGVKQLCPMYAIFFSIYIDKLEDCLCYNTHKWR
jgi:hypothetical protein